MSFLTNWIVMRSTRSSHRNKYSYNKQQQVKSDKNSDLYFYDRDYLSKDDNLKKVNLIQKDSRLIQSSEKRRDQIKELKRKRKKLEMLKNSKNIDVKIKCRGR